MCIQQGKESKVTTSAERIADFAGRQIGVPANLGVLKRMARRTKAQVGLTGDARRANLHDAFRSTANLTGKAILLIDDVSTTAATLRECSKVLRMQVQRLSMD